MKLEWEQVEHNHGNAIHRAKVFGGWLIMSTDEVQTQVYEGYDIPSIREGYEWKTSITFMADINHQWV
jgi:hypothetical protein